LRRHFYRLICRLAGALVHAAPLSVAVDHEAAIGLSAGFLKEQQQRLELPDVVAAYRAEVY